MSTPDYKGHDSLADMIKGHLTNWQLGLKSLKELALLRGDTDDTSYWDHELSALADVAEATKCLLVEYDRPIHVDLAADNKLPQ